MIATRDISPLELTRAMLERIESLDGELKSYATVMPERALADAKRAEHEIAAGNRRGPLHGVPIAVKDLCYTQGTRTMGGLGVRNDFVPGFDSTVVARLEGAGAVLLGKLNMTEGAMGGYHPDFDIPINPWDADYWSGASSSGSGVAVAAGLCFAALGSDTGGSIRFPSMANGITGLKPTYGRVSRYGVLPLGETLDHVGPMARSVADVASVFEVIAGHDASDATTLADPVPDMCDGIDAGIEGMTIGYDRAFSANGVDASLVSSMERALDELSELGATIKDIQMPGDTKGVGETWFAICSYEARQAHADTFPARADEYGAYFREFLEIGASVSGDEYAAASSQRREFSRRFEDVLATVDAVACPAGGSTFPVSQQMQYGNSAALQPLFDAVRMYFTIPADFAGTPALTIPCGFSGDGIPYGFQLMGPRLSEQRLCRIGHAYQSDTGWHLLHPGIDP
jgi:amidase